MEPYGLVFLKVLLNKYALGGKETALKSLPKEQLETLTKIATTSQDVGASLSWSHQIFSHMHYSWIAPLVKDLSPSLQRVTIASLPETSGEKLKKLLGITSKVTIPSQKLKNYFLKKLYHRWKPTDAVPQELLEETPLMPLLSLTKEQMVLLLDLLALNDLAESIRHIVDKSTLTAVYSNLTHTEQAFLRVCLHQRDKLKVTKVDVAKLKNTPQELKKALHKRGLFRLGKALCGQKRQFMWHVTHILDTGRGAALEEYYTDQPVQGVTTMLIHQTLAAINFIKEGAK